MFIEDDGVTFSDNVPLVMQYVLDYLDDEALKNNVNFFSFLKHKFIFSDD